MLQLRKITWIFICWLALVISAWSESVELSSLFLLLFGLSLAIPAKWMCPMPWERKTHNFDKEEN